jgi:hypothetical protein
LFGDLLGKLPNSIIVLPVLSAPEGRSIRDVTSRAPSDYDALRRAYRHSKATGCPLPVNSLHNGRTIYRSRVSNLAFCFWHDVTHVKLGCDFGLEGETRVAMAQLDILRGFGFEPCAREYRLLFADTYGQTIYNIVIESFPEDQESFVRTAITSSVPEAIRRALRADGGNAASPAAPTPSTPGRQRGPAFPTQIERPGR